MPRPNLFLFGAAKAGTTALHEYLSHHPSVFMSPVKEPHHFGSDLKLGEGWHVPRREDYEALFDAAADTPVRGESSVFYMISEHAAREVHRYTGGDARLVVMLRDPVSAVWALHWQFLKSANETLTNLNDALDAEPRRAEGRKLPPMNHNHLALLYTRTYDYPPHLDRIDTVFPPDRVHIELFDDLQQDPAALYARVLRFLGVDPSFTPAFEVVNKAAPVRNLPLRQSLARSPALKRAWGKLPTRVRGAAGSLAASLIRDKQTRAALTPAVAARLAERFEPTLPALEERLGRDLTHWRHRWHTLASADAPTTSP